MFDALKTEIQLTLGTSYSCYVWAYNSCGSSPVTTLSGQTLALAIGVNYQGGIIFHLDGTGQHGLISATSDQSAAAEWGCFGTLIGTSAANGAGQSNTTAIVAGCSTADIAARICDDLVLNGFNDWFLPSKDEIYQMYLHKDVIGGFNTYIYWSSSEYLAGYAWYQNFYNGLQAWDSKNYTKTVRAVRAF